MSVSGHINREGARYVGDPTVFARADRTACLYAAALAAKHMPAFASIAHEFEAVLRPPATIVLLRHGDPEGAALTYEIPALLLAAQAADRPVQRDFEE